MKRFKSRLVLQRIQSEQDPDAFAALYDAYVTKMFRFISYKVGNREVAEDLTSDLFLKLWEYLIEKRSEEIKSLNGLIYRMARNLVIDHYRSKSRTEECSIENILHLGKDTGELERVHIQIEAAKLLELIRTLKVEYQEVLLLRYVEELSTKEMADVMEKKRGTVRVTLHRATKTLQNLIDTSS
jgi:RNA polymerase sigma-70 factor, ECF subfamily